MNHNLKVSAWYFFPNRTTVAYELGQLVSIFMSLNTGQLEFGRPFSLAPKLTFNKKTVVMGHFELGQFLSSAVQSMF